MLLKPSRHTFTDMMDKIPTTVSYDGGDTGFLNAYYPNWYNGNNTTGGENTTPNQRRLAFGYNAQRFLYDCTYKKQPRYWDVAVASTQIAQPAPRPKHPNLPPKPNARNKPPAPHQQHQHRTSA